jgi:prepilin-type N-terminal cleavage/methylation domain-containing protein
MRRLRARYEQDAGFTAVEMVIAMLILGIIIVPLLSSYVLGIGTVAQSNATTNDSADTQNLSSFFVNDVASAYRASTAGGCGSDTVVKFELGKAGSNASPFYVAYGATEDGGAEASQHISPIYNLTRYTCDASGATVDSTLVASELTSPPTLTCAGLSVANCDATSRKPTLVSLAVTEWGRNQADTTYSFTISGTRRVTG